jgi:hypothetical protein
MKWIHLSVVCLCLGLLSCGGEKDADKVGDAQFCLDKLSATPSSAEVDTCLEKIEGMDSIGAENIRCAAGFIREGFASGSRFVEAFEAIDSGTSGANMQALMGILTFASTNTITENYSNAASTYTSCLASGGKGSTLLASFSYLTMSLVRFFHTKDALVCPTTPIIHPTSGYRYYNMEDCAANTAPLDLVDMVDPNSPNAESIEVQTGIGSVIVGTSVVSCGTNVANTELCEVFTNAITAAGGSTNTRQVAIEFFKSLLGI